MMMWQLVRGVLVVKMQQEPQVTPSDVSNRLGLSINLSLLQRQPSTPAASSTPFSDIATWVGPFVEPVGPTKPLAINCYCNKFF